MLYAGEVTDLVASFRTHAPASAGGVDAGSLAPALDELVARGAEAWPKVRVDPVAVVEQAARLLPASLQAEEVADSLAALHAGDLHLACGCAAHSAAALAAFDGAFLDARALGAALHRLDRSPIFADEVRQAVREKLFVARKGAPVRIAGYSGRAPLSAWLRVVLVRTAVDLHRAGGAANADNNDGRAAGEQAAGESPELRFLKDRYGPIYQDAVRAALATLDDGQRKLLRLQLVEGLSSSRIAGLLGVDRSTITRRIAGCRAQLMSEIRERLRTSLRISTAELNSLAELVKSQLHVSVVRLLGR